MGKKSSEPKPTEKLGHYIMAPFRALVRARDKYVNTMTNYASRAQRGRVVASSVPRSQSHGFYNRTGSGEDDIRDLIRAASKRSKDLAVVPRSQSVAVGIGIGRIEEDREFEDEAVYPRSRSVAVMEKGKVGRLMG
ncbi:uncharacterized protein A4U43_C08F15260 [Asparagus officinalis]|uniref:uncharacterized protein LOC109822848 n=1 Tax=Asparagus officinalis TaxID=4686 RepID=UPI00098E414D|nr:uncharacterized protein LOC109822848 [Asparagus officinalis]ONK60182.1 uncharacterized protein A4U43_C08F15260 [Asparagus officinalis]